MLLVLSFLLHPHYGRRESGHRFPFGRGFHHVNDEVAWPETTYNAHKVVSGLLKCFAVNKRVVRVVILLAVRVRRSIVGTTALRGTIDPI